MTDDISTIFVVGFPDDMLEREFQNMFMFCHGFEAATLKVPTKDSDIDDAFVNGASASTSSNASDTVSPTASSAPSLDAKKQIIGFAKFKSRTEALEARDRISGRKVDSEKGSILKAEMAKKNLHTKRGLSSDAEGASLNGNSNASSATPTSIPGNRLQSQAAYNAFHSVPASSTNGSDFSAPEPYYDFYSEAFSPPTASSLFSESSFPSTRGSIDGASVPRGMDQFPNGPSGSSIPRGLAPQRYGPPPGSNSKFLINGSNPDDDLHPLSHLSKSTPATNGHSLYDDIGSRFNSLSINTQHPPLTSPGLTSPSLPSPGFRPPPINPADQNPPCNTLYVGNLPMNTNEEELRQMFCRCPGYRRLCFRTKANGPMCFVEFEDVQAATRALNELHGNPLSNSIKGGIRLSYSKNPLGVRTNANPNNPANLISNGPIPGPGNSNVPINNLNGPAAPPFLRQQRPQHFAFNDTFFDSSF